MIALSLLHEHADYLRWCMMFMALIEFNNDCVYKI